MAHEGPTRRLDEGQKQVESIQSRGVWNEVLHLAFEQEGEMLEFER